jgi:hypothetical protein
MTAVGRWGAWDFLSPDMLRREGTVHLFNPASSVWFRMLEAENNAAFRPKLNVRAGSDNSPITVIASDHHSFRKVPDAANACRY